MSKSRYNNYSENDLILRDVLAIDRTKLQNENTILAYIRTSLTIIITGVSLIKFFTQSVINILGGIIVMIGIVVLIIGFVRYKQVNRELSTINKR